jgi:hypothetical protein
VDIHEVEGSYEGLRVVIRVNLGHTVVLHALVIRSGEWLVGNSWESEVMLVGDDTVCPVGPRCDVVRAMMCWNVFRLLGGLCCSFRIALTDERPTLLSQDEQQDEHLVGIYDPWDVCAVIEISIPRTKAASSKITIVTSLRGP